MVKKMSIILTPAKKIYNKHMRETSKNFRVPKKLTNSISWLLTEQLKIVLALMRIKSTN